MKKQLVKLFKKHKLKIEIISGVKVVNFLDVKFDLTKNMHRPYHKPNHIPKYLHVDSDHPPTVISSVPKTVETRLSLRSSSRQVFEEEKGIYQKALEDAGHKVNLQYKEIKKKKRVRMRQITWFNPPYSGRVQTNVGRKFLQLLDKHFPKNSPLHKIMNRNLVKISYSTTKNMQRHLDAHNKKVLAGEEADANARMCNCRGGPEQCPLQGKCLIKSVVYEAEVETAINTKTYYGLTERTFKDRFNQHQSDIRHEKNRHSTALSSYVHSLKDENIPYTIKWKINSRAYPYQCGGRQCDLCLQEKLVICLADPEKTLNSRTEIVSKCRHKRKFTLRVCASKNPP